MAVTSGTRAGNALSSPLSTAASSARVITEPKVAPALLKPLAPERFRVQFTVTRETFEKLRRVQDLMRHTCPDGDVGIVFERALTMLLQHLEKIKFAQASRPQVARGTMSGSRRIPSAVRRAVWARDDGQCAFIGTRGRCTERGFLEFHHVVPFADGGLAVVDNIQLRCRAHNQYESDRWFGTREPVVRERRDFSGWSNSVRTESSVHPTGNLSRPGTSAELMSLPTRGSFQPGGQTHNGRGLSREPDGSGSCEEISADRAVPEHADRPTDVPTTSGDRADAARQWAALVRLRLEVVELPKQMCPDCSFARSKLLTNHTRDTKSHALSIVDPGCDIVTSTLRPAPLLWSPGYRSCLFGDLEFENA